MRSGAALAIVLLSCGRDLTVPAARTPPALASIDPAKAFAGESVALHGTNLGAPAATGQQDAQADGSLVVLVPAGLDKTALDVSISNAQGRSVLAAGFSYLGLGHPATLSLRGSARLSAKLTSVSVLGATGFFFD